MSFEQFRSWIESELARIEEDQKRYLPAARERGDDGPDGFVRLSDRQRAYREGYLIGARVMWDKFQETRK
jgi:hypothetical protein